MTNEVYPSKGKPRGYRIPIAERLWPKVNKDGPIPEWNPSLGNCWLWTGHLDQGYGTISLGGERPKFARVHRVSYEALVGPIPEGLQLDHLCRVRNCVRPEHLEPVTGRENTLRGIGLTAANAAKTHCPKGHEYSADNTYLNTTRGLRICRTCNRERMHEKRSVSAVTPAMQSMGEQIRAAKAATGLSNANLAKRFGVSTSAVARMVRGETWN